MGEYAAKFRPDIDLDEFERRLRAAAPAPAPQSRDQQLPDPLAELARLVGGEGGKKGNDPFEALFRAQSAIADIRHAPEPQAPREPYFEDEASLQGYELRKGEAEHPAQPGQTAHFAGEPLPYHEADPHWIDEQPAAPAAWSGEHDEYHAPPRAGRGKVFYGMVSLLALGVVGIGTTLGLRAKSGSHDVVTIQADSDPARVKPAASDNAASSSSQTLFDRKDNSTTAKVVSGAEQPADLGATAKAARVVSAAAEAPAAPSPSASGQGGANEGVFPAPKKVKTVSVRADGSVIQGQDAQPQLARGLPSMATGGLPAGAAPARSAPTPAAANKAPATASTGHTATSTTEAALKTSARVKPGKPAATAAAEPVGETGPFAVQLAGSPVESEARAAANKLSEKYASVLNGRHATFVQAKVGDKTVYRVRVGHLTEDAAKQMCTAIKGQGGNCFVAKN